MIKKFFYLFLVLFFGLLVRQELVGGTKFGIVSKTALSIVEIPAKFKNYVYSSFFKEQSSFLVTKNLRHSNKKKGFEIHQPKNVSKIEDKILLLSKYDGDLLKTVIEIYDLGNFKKIHTIIPNYDKINNLTKFDKLKHIKYDLEDFIVTSPRIDDNGNIVFNNWSVVSKINLCGDPLWVNQDYVYKQNITIDSKGNYWIPSTNLSGRKDYEEIIGSKFGNFKEDEIISISAEGKTIYKKSLIDIFEQNKLLHLVFGQSLFIKDPFHVTNIEPVIADGKFWKKDDLIINIRNMSLILIYRPSTNKVINLISGAFFHQQQVNIFSEEEISIFNNNRRTFWNPLLQKKILDKQNNQLLIYNLKTKKFRELMSKNFTKYNIRTESDGKFQILDDGSLFVEESLYGRILYFNKNEELMFEYINKDKKNVLFPLYFSNIIENKKKLNKLKSLIENKDC